MARRRRTPKAQPAPITYLVESEEITPIVAALFTRFEVHFNDVRQLSIAYVMVAGGREPKRDRIDGVWAGFKKCAPLEKALHGYDAILWVRDAIWKVIDPKQREALLAHQLSHGLVTEKGALAIQKHDVEDFAFVARHWGPWYENVELYGKQLSLFGTPETDGANGNGHAHDDAFADIDEKVAEQKAEASNVTQLPQRSARADQPHA